MPPLKKMIYLELQQGALLKRLSLEEKASETEVMRRALAFYARERLRDPLAELIGAFTGAPKDSAAQHDRYLRTPRRAPRATR